jgi:hypothetical protein
MPDLALNPSPLSLATAAAEIIRALADKAVPDDRVAREVAAIIAGWVTRPGAIEAMEILRDQLELAVEVAASDLRHLRSDYAPAHRHAERGVTGLTAALSTVKTAIAEL